MHTVFRAILPLSTAFVTLAASTTRAQAPSAAQFGRAFEYATRSRTQALLVMHDGAIVHERYASGGGVGTRLLVASGSKSFVGVAALAAVHDRHLRLDDRVSGVLTEWNRDPRSAATTYRQLLSLSSGMVPGNAGTGCGGPGKTWNDAVSTSWKAAPGRDFAYGPYPFIAFGAALERILRTESFAAYLQRRIAAPLGITVEWRVSCGDGKPQLAGGAAVTARDWATFGEMLRRGGVHNGQRLLEASLIQQLFTSSTANPSYGLSWWLRGATLRTNPALGPAVDDADSTTPSTGAAAARGGGRLRERLAARRTGGGAATTAPRDTSLVPTDLVMAAGAGKQRLYILPSRKLVIVRLGPIASGRDFDDVAFLTALFAAR
jgi:CubicO group peptidase (beta-lactamase class C family)